MKASFSALAKSLPTLKQFILSPQATFQSVVSNRIDVGLWTVGRQTLVLATNLNYEQVSLSLGTVRISKGAKVDQVFDSGAKVSGSTLVFESVGSGGFIVS